VLRSWGVPCASYSARRVQRLTVDKSGSEHPGDSRIARICSEASTRRRTTQRGNPNWTPIALDERHAVRIWRGWFWEGEREEG
jgi:hypothetical protein